MPKATSLTPEAMEPQHITPLAATKQRGGRKPVEKIKPLQFRPTEHQAWEIKKAAADAHLNITDFMLLCFHEHMENRKHKNI